MAALLFVAGLFLALSNGANDNFKGLATIWGSHALGYRSALLIATLATLVGGLAAMLLGHALVKTFSGNGLVPAEVAAAPAYMLSVAFGAGATVMAATRIGMPVSTTHALIGGLVGAGLAYAGGAIDLAQLGARFVLPLLLSPLAAGSLAILAYRLRRRTQEGGGRPACICIVHPPGVDGASAATLSAVAAPRLLVASEATCDTVPGPLIRFPRLRSVENMHLASAASICLARGMNDAPKIAALVMAADLSGGTASIGLVALAMAVGGMILARRVAETMSLRLNRMDPVQGLSANLVTAGLVICATGFGLPVSTTHVSVGSIAGAGAAAGTLESAVFREILLAWVATLPAAAILAWAAAFALT